MSENAKYKSANDVCLTILKNVMSTMTDDKYVKMCENKDKRKFDYKCPVFSWLTSNSLVALLDPIEVNYNDQHFKDIATKIIDISNEIINKKLFSSHHKCVKFFNKHVKPYVKVNEKHVRENNIVHLDIDALLDPFITAYQQFVLSDNMDKIIKSCSNDIYKKVFKTIDNKRGVGVLTKDESFNNVAHNLSYLVEQSCKTMFVKSVEICIKNMCEVFTKLFFSMVYIKFINFCLFNIKHLSSELAYIANDIKIFYTRNVRNLWYNYEYFNKLRIKLLSSDPKTVTDTVKMIEKEYKVWIGKYPEFKRFDNVFFDLNTDNYITKISNNKETVNYLTDVLFNVSEKICSQIRNSFGFNLSDIFKEWLTHDDSILFKPNMFTILNDHDKRFDVNKEEN